MFAVVVTSFPFSNWQKEKVLLNPLVTHLYMYNKRPYPVKTGWVAFTINDNDSIMHQMTRNITDDKYVNHSNVILERNNIHIKWIPANYFVTNCTRFGSYYGDMGMVRCDIGKVFYKPIVDLNIYWTKNKQTAYRQAT